MERHLNRRSLVKGTAAVAGAAAISKRSTSFAAPAVVKQTGSTIDITYWGSYEGSNGDAEKEVVKRFNESEQRLAFGHPSSGSYIAWLFQGVTWAFGGNYSDADFNIQIAEPDAVAAGEFYRSSVADGWASTPDDVVADFSSGLIASMMASTGSLTGVKEQVGDSFNFKTAFLLEEEQFGCCTGGAGLSVMSAAAAEKQEAAFKYIAFATSPEITAFWSQNTGYMPVRKSAVESEEMQAFFEENPNFKTAVEQLPLTQPQDAARVFIPNGDQIIGRGLEEITINLSEVQPSFDDVAATLEEEAQPIVEQLAEL